MGCSTRSPRACHRSILAHAPASFAAHRRLRSCAAERRRKDCLRSCVVPLLAMADDMRARRERAAAAAEARARGAAPPTPTTSVAPQPEPQPEPEPGRPAGLARRGIRSSGFGAGAGTGRPLLLVLDLDGTLLSARRVGSSSSSSSSSAQPRRQRHRQREGGCWGPGPPAFTLRERGGYEVWLRPGCAELLAAARTAGWDLAVWTAAPAEYAHLMIRGIQEHAPCSGFATSLRAVFSEEQTEVRWCGSAVVKKDLRKIAAGVHVPLWRCLVVDDTPSTYSGNAANALPVPTWYAGMAADDTLPALASFLLAAAAATAAGGPLDTRGWRHASSHAGVLSAAKHGGHMLGSAAAAAAPAPAAATAEHDAAAGAIGGAASGVGSTLGDEDVGMDLDDALIC